MDVEGPGDCGSGVSAAEVNGIGDRWSGDTTTVDTDTHTSKPFWGTSRLGIFFLIY